MVGKNINLDHNIITLLLCGLNIAEDRNFCGLRQKLCKKLLRLSTMVKSKIKQH